MTHNQRVGKWGEKAAASYLNTHGYEIVKINVRTPYGEIDLIAKKDDLMIFVEVKARTSKNYGPPEVAVTPRANNNTWFPVPNIMPNKTKSITGKSMCWLSNRLATKQRSSILKMQLPDLTCDTPSPSLNSCPL